MFTLVFISIVKKATSKDVSQLVLIMSNILLGNLFSNTSNFGFSLEVRDHDSQPSKTNGKLIVLYILIFSLRWSCGLWRHVEDGGGMFLRNDGAHTASQPRSLSTSIRLRTSDLIGLFDLQCFEKYTIDNSFEVNNNKHFLYSSFP
jgi:hypothetical protein